MSNNIVYDYITEYIRNTVTSDDSLLKQLEKYANENNVPIIQPEVAKLIEVLLEIISPKNILEIGTAIGYSSILMSKFLKDNGKIITIERDNNMLEKAKENIKCAELEKIITICEGEALEILPGINEKFDVVFIDAGKGHYLEFFNQCIQMLNDGGLIISDNVLYKGMIASDTLVTKKQKTIVNRMREYLQFICNHEQFDTSIIPIGDGVALSYKRR